MAGGCHLVTLGLLIYALMRFHKIRHFYTDPPSQMRWFAALGGVLIFFVAVNLHKFGVLTLPDLLFFNLFLLGFMAFLSWVLHLTWEHLKGVQDELDSVAEANINAALLVEELEDANQALENMSASLRQARDEAEMLNALKSRFLANMSHELRTPMNGLLGMMQLLERTELTQEQQNRIAVMAQSGESLIMILNDMLDYSQMEAGTLKLNPEPVELGGCLDKIVSAFMASAEQKGLILRCEKPAKLPWVSLDPLRFEQVLNNLISNAIKFTPAGEVVLTVKPELAAQGKQKLCFTLQDTGPGIPPEARQHIFGSFYQVDHGHARSTGGTGLGLAISKELLSLMGGELRLAECSDTGSSFAFELELPVLEGKPAVEVPDSQNQGFHLPTSRVLVAEDNAINLKLAIRFIETLGLEAHGAKNGLEALDLLQEAPDAYSVIFMDMEMPELDGLDATRQIRLLYGQQHVIIALTANALAESREECLQAGMNDFLTKPVKIEKIRQVLQVWFPIKQASEILI